MSDQPRLTPFQQLLKLPYPVIIFCVALLALGGAAGHSLRESTESSIGYWGSVLVSAVPCVAALFAVGLAMRYDWRIAITGSLVLVVGLFAFEELPKLLESHLGAGFVCHFVAGITALLGAFATYVILAKILGIKSQAEPGQ